MVSFSPRWARKKEREKKKEFYTNGGNARNTYNGSSTTWPGRQATGNGITLVAFRPGRVQGALYPVFSRGLNTAMDALPEALPHDIAAGDLGQRASPVQMRGNMPACSCSPNHGRLCSFPPPFLFSSTIIPGQAVVAALWPEFCTPPPQKKTQKYTNPRCRFRQTQVSSGHTATCSMPLLALVHPEHTPVCRLLPLAGAFSTPWRTSFFGG